MAGDGGGVVTNERTGQSYDTITKAVEEAEDDDVIIVGAGTYEESVVIDKALTIKGEHGAVVEGVDYYTFSLQASGVSLTGLTIRNAGVNGYDDFAVVVDYDSLESEGPVSWSITNCRLDGAGEAKAGIHVCGDVDIPSEIVISNNVIENFYEDGIDFYYCKEYVADINLTVKGNEIKDVNYGISFYELYDSTIILENNTIESAYDCIYIYCLEGCDFTVNKGNLLSTGDNNIYVSYDVYDSTFTITECILQSPFNSNIDVSYGFEGSTFTLTGNTLQSPDYDALEIDFYYSEFIINQNQFSGDDGVFIGDCIYSTGEIRENDFQVEDIALDFGYIESSNVTIYGRAWKPALPFWEENRPGGAPRPYIFYIFQRCIGV